MTRNLKTLADMSPAVKGGTVIYSRSTMPPLTANYADVKSAFSWAD